MCICVKEEDQLFVLCSEVLERLQKERKIGLSIIIVTFTFVISDFILITFIHLLDFFNRTVSEYSSNVKIDFKLQSTPHD